MDEERPVQHADETASIETTHGDEAELPDEALDNVSGGDFTFTKSTDTSSPKLNP